MKTFSKICAAAFVSSVLMTSQAFAATAPLHALDPWDNSVEGHLSASEKGIGGTGVNTGYGETIRDVWGNDIHSGH